MAQAAKYREYDSYYGSNAAYDEFAVRVMGGQEALQPDPRVSPRPRRRTMARPKRQAAARPRVRVREAGTVSPFAVCGFAVAAVMAVLILVGYAHLMALSNEVVSLQSQMEELEGEETVLRTRYDLAYDLNAIEAAVTADGSMRHPLPSQMVYVDLTAPDSVVRYYPEEESEGGFMDSVHEIIQKAVAYF